MTLIIQVAVWSHGEGYSVGSFQTVKGAENWRQEIVADNWEDEMSPIEKPSDPKEAADMYFNADRAFNNECFEVLPTALEG